MLTASLMGAAYAYLLLYFPIVGWITFVFTAGYGAFAGTCTAMFLRWGKVRNHRMGLAVILGTQLVGYYVTWAVWVHALLVRSDGTTVSLWETFHPTYLVTTIFKINEVGAWSVGGSGIPVTAGSLWIAWILEAILLFWGATQATSEIADPFCEDCQRWCVAHKAATVLESSSLDDVRGALEQGDYERLQSGSGLSVASHG